MRVTIPLEFNKYYHIYNRGINSCELFKDEANYNYFLRLHNKYIPFNANTYAWCLMWNHFHFLVKIKDEEEIDFIPLKKKSLSGHKAADRISINKAEIQSVVKNPDCGFMKKNTKLPLNVLIYLIHTHKLLIKNTSALEAYSNVCFAE